VAPTGIAEEAAVLASLDPLTQGEELKGMAAFIHMPHVFFIAEYGLDHWETSMKAQYELTQRFPAEYSIRAFLEREPERTLEQMHDENALLGPARLEVIVNGATLARDSFTIVE
jgi:hypothetical protein